MDLAVWVSLRVIDGKNSPLSWKTMGLKNGDDNVLCETIK